MSYSGSHDNTSGVGSYSRESPRVSAVSIPWLRHGTVDDSDIGVIMDSVELTNNYEPLNVASPLLSFPGASPSSSGEDNDDLSNAVTEISRHLLHLQSAVRDLGFRINSYGASRHGLADIRHTLEGASRFLSVLKRLQEGLYNLEKQDHIPSSSRLNFTELLRQSRVTQYHLQSFEIASLRIMSNLKSADESRVCSCFNSFILAHNWRELARSYSSQLPMRPEWTGAPCNNPSCSRLAR